MKTATPTPEQVAEFLRDRLHKEYEPGTGRRHDFHIEMDFEGTEECLSVRGIYMQDYTEEWDETSYFVQPGPDGLIVSMANIYSYATGEQIDLDPKAIQEAYNRDSLRWNHRQYGIDWLMDRIGGHFFEKDPDRAYEEAMMEEMTA